MTVTVVTSRNNVKAVPTALTGQIVHNVQTARNSPNRKPRATSRNRRVPNPNRSKPVNVTRHRNVWNSLIRPGTLKARKRGLWIEQLLQPIFKPARIASRRLTHVAGAKINDSTLFRREGSGKFFHRARVAQNDLVGLINRMCGLEKLF